MCPVVVVFSGDADSLELLSRVFLWKKEEMPEEELDWFLEQRDGELEGKEPLLLLVSDEDSTPWVFWDESDSAKGALSPSSFLTSFCFSAAFLKKDWMLPACLLLDWLFASSAGWAAGRPWVEGTSLDRNPAMLPAADGASLNLPADRCSRVRGGDLRDTGQITQDSLPTRDLKVQRDVVITMPTDGPRRC